MVRPQNLKKYAVVNADNIIINIIVLADNHTWPIPEGCRLEPYVQGSAGDVYQSA